MTSASATARTCATPARCSTAASTRAPSSSATALAPALHACQRQAVGERGAEDRRVRGQGGRLPPGALPRADAPGRPPLRGLRAPDDRQAPRLPAADEQRQLLGRLLARAADAARALARQSQPRGGGQGLRRGRDPLPALQLHPRRGARLHAALRRAAAVRVARVLAARRGECARLRGRRLPRLLDRGLRAR